MTKYAIYYVSKYSEVFHSVILPRAVDTNFAWWIRYTAVRWRWRDMGAVSVVLFLADVSV